MVCLKLISRYLPVEADEQHNDYGLSQDNIPLLACRG